MAPNPSLARLLEATNVRDVDADAAVARISAGAS